MSVTSSATPLIDPELKRDLDCITALEAELQDIFADRNPHFLGAASQVTDAQWFLLGAIKRTAAQAAGFRAMIEAENAPSATGLLRLQLDTAMRLNGLRTVADREEACRSLMNGAKFSDLRGEGGKTRLRDAELKRMLNEQHSWVASVYDEASEYVHLSGSHMKSAIGAVIGGRIFFNLGPKDPSNYKNRHLALARAFFMATEVAVELIFEDLEMIDADEIDVRHRRREPCRPVVEEA